MSSFSQQMSLNKQWKLDENIKNNQFCSPLRQRDNSKSPPQRQREYSNSCWQASELSQRGIKSMQAQKVGLPLKKKLNLFNLENLGDVRTNQLFNEGASVSDNMKKKYFNFLRDTRSGELSFKLLHFKNQEKNDIQNIVFNHRRLDQYSSNSPIFSNFLLKSSLPVSPPPDKVSQYESKRKLNLRQSNQLINSIPLLKQKIKDETSPNTTRNKEQMTKSKILMKSSQKLTHINLNDIFVTPITPYNKRGSFLRQRVRVKA